MNMANKPATERVPAPAPRAYQMQVEQLGGGTNQYSRRFPEVRGGICEFCGVIDPNQPSQFQYKLCPHFRGMQLACTYCGTKKNPDDVIYHANLKVQEHPDNPNKLVVWCDSYECSKAHLERFQKGGS